MNTAQTISQSALRLYEALTVGNPPPWKVEVDEHGRTCVTDYTESTVMLLESYTGDGDMIQLDSTALKQIAHFVNEVGQMKGAV